MDTIICTTKQTPKNVKFGHYYVCDIFIWCFTNYASWSKNTYINLWKTVIMNGKITWFMIHKFKNAINCNFMHIFERQYIEWVQRYHIYEVINILNVTQLKDSTIPWKRIDNIQLEKNLKWSGYYIKLTLHCSVNDIYILF